LPPTATSSPSLHDALPIFRMLCGDLGERRTLRAVALAGAAEDRDELSLRKGAEQPEHLVEGLGRVGVIDDHAERLPAFDSLHAADRKSTRLNFSHDQISYA